MKNSSIFIGVAAHKKYRMPASKMYHPVQVGASRNPAIEDYQSDAIGENISSLNPYFSELTGLYWVWKNVNDVEFKGLVHYRRHFTDSKSFNQFKKGSFDEVINEKELLINLKDVQAVLPKKRHYYIESLYSHYKHSHDIEPLNTVKRIIDTNFPDYSAHFDEVLARKSAHMFNMLIMKSEAFDSYCQWLFAILFELQEKVDLTKYNQQEARLFGYISELLLDVWIETNNVSYRELPVMFMEKQNWLVKGGYFLLRKIAGGSKRSAHMEN